MPVYDYICQECHATFDIKTTVAEYEKGLDARCPVCNSRQVKRALSGVSFATGNTVRESTTSHAGPSCGCGGHCHH